METTETFTTEMGVVVALLGFIIYWGIMINKKRAEKGKKFDLRFWWNDNTMNVLMSFCACLCVFIYTYSVNELTFDRCLLMTFGGSFLVDRMKKTISG